LHLIIALAAAAEGEGPVLASAGWRQGQTGAFVAGGLDHWQGSGWGAAEARVWGWAEHDGPELGTWAAGSASVEWLEGGTWLDAQSLSAGVGADNRWAPGAELGWVSGVTGAPWFEASLSPSLGPVLGSGRLTAGAGGLVRGDAQISGLGGLAWLRGHGSLGPVGLGGVGRVRRMGSGLTPWAFDGGAWVALQRRGWSADANLGGTLVPDSEALQGAGLAAPGSRIVRGTVGMNGQLRGPLRARLEVGLETSSGSVEYRRVRAQLGLALDLSGGGPARVQASAPVLSHHAPDALEVSVMGSFTEWEPLPLEREGGLWVLELDLPPGTYEYVLLVDGQIVVPEGPTRPDGFGGENGVLTTF
jgi:hypothetical protein